MVNAIEVAGDLLLFALVFGMSATVDMNCLQEQLRNRNAILTGMFLQFVVLPFLGFLVVKALSLDHSIGLTLLIVTSSPGGSYSNWYECHFLLQKLLIFKCRMCASHSPSSFLM
jgi:predicted Na+-dependent transporter